VPEAQVDEGSSRGLQAARTRAFTALDNAWSVPRLGHAFRELANAESDAVADAICGQQAAKRSVVRDRDPERLNAGLAVNCVPYVLRAWLDNSWFERAATHAARRLNFNGPLTVVEDGDDDGVRLARAPTA
jgi:hypothetical protein